MTTLNSIAHPLARTQTGPQSVFLQVGSRALSIGRDFRKRYYETHPIMGMYPGINKGYLEVLLFRRWVLVLSKA